MSNGNQVTRMDVQFTPFPYGYCPSDPNDFGTQLSQRLIVSPAFGFYGINIGPTAPTNTDIPWFNTTANDWYYYNTIAGQWLPVRPGVVTGEVQVGTTIWWDGQISLVNAFWGSRWLFANGDAISRTTYSDYFGLIGTKWGVGDGSTTFNIIDLRDSFPVGASADTAGQATTTVDDGVTTSTQRAYLTHRHERNNPTPDQGIGSLGAGSASIYTGIETAGDASGNAIRVLPPYKALVPIVRVL